MEPQLPKPQINLESMPLQPQKSGESFSIPKAQESVTAPVEQGKETREVFRDQPSSGPNPAQSVFTPPPLPTISADSTSNVVVDPVADENPSAASDDDLIEKEWVEKAKRVVSETRDDPYQQDAAIGRLQADYLKKRYGKEVASPNGG